VVPLLVPLLVPRRPLLPPFPRCVTVTACRLSPSVGTDFFVDFLKWVATRATDTPGWAPVAQSIVQLVRGGLYPHLDYRLY
jgi:hypothetical protein